MSEDLGTLRWVVDADTRPALNSMSIFDRMLGRTEARTQTAASRISSSLSKIAAGVSVGLFVKQLVSTQRELDKLNASLLTSTGSIDKSALAFSELEKFAKETPYALQQSVDAFTKLVNLGLTPSQEAMKSYGDTAAAMGKDLSQMIEAVADAATGEFERLKEFGIKAKNQGDTIDFIFRGVTTSVANNAAAIEKHLISLGQNNFAGAMANRMDTLDGKISNFSDTWDQLLRTVNSGGSGAFMADAVQVGIDALDRLIFMLESGELTGYIEVIRNSFKASFGTIAQDLATLTDFLVGEFDVMKKTGGSVPEFLADAFFQFPANVKAAIQIATVEILAFVDKAAVYAKMLDAYLNPANLFNGSDIGKQYGKELKQIESVRKSVADSILKEREKSIKKVDEEREAVERSTIAFKENQEAKLASSKGVDTLAQFKAVVPKNANKDVETAEQKRNRLKAERKAERDAEKEKSEAVDATASIISRGKTPEEERQIESDLLDKWRKKELINATEFEDAKTQIEKEGAEARVAAQEAVNAISLNSMQQLTSAIMSSVDEQSNAYKIAFAAQQAAAVAQILVATEVAAAQVLAHDAGILGLGALATSNVIRGMGYASAGITAGVAIAGGREHGGSVIGGQTYEMGEKNKPELLVIPGNNGKVLSNAEMKGLSGGGGGQLNQTINNYASNDGYEVRTRGDGVNTPQVLDIVRAEMGNSNSIGWRGMQNTSNLKNRSRSRR